MDLHLRAVKSPSGGHLPTGCASYAQHLCRPVLLESLSQLPRCRLQQETAERTTSEELLSRHRRQSAEVCRLSDAAVTSVTTFCIVLLMIRQ